MEDGKEVSKIPIKVGDETIWVETVKGDKVENDNSIMLPLDGPDAGDNGGITMHAAEEGDDFEPPQQSIVPKKRPLR